MNTNKNKPTFRIRDLRTGHIVARGYSDLAQVCRKITLAGHEGHSWGWEQE